MKRLAAALAMLAFTLSATGAEQVVAIQAATINGADLPGWKDRGGSITPGKYADVVAVGSDVARDLCRLCAEVCTACGDECGKHPMDHCQACAQACRACADACRRMAGAD